MIKKLSALKARLEKGKKDNKGFTLVELIVVIVILAILVGVTIGGVYGYVNKSRINTDINNASALSSTLSTATVSKEIGNAECTAVAFFKVADTDAGTTAEAIAKAIVGDSASEDQIKVFQNLLPDGVDAAKVGVLGLTTTVDDKNHLTSIKVVAYEAGTTANTGTKLVAAE